MGESQETLLTTQSEEPWHGDLPREGRGSAAAHSPAGGRASRCQQMCPGARALWKKTQAATQGRGGRAELTGTAPGFVPCTWGPMKVVSELANRCLFWKSLRTQRDLKMATSLKAHFCLRARVGWARVG